MNKQKINLLLLEKKDIKRKWNNKILDFVTNKVRDVQVHDNSH